MIERRIDLTVPPARAWRAWTERIALWWPPGHLKHKGTMVLEGRIGGRLYERSDATEFDWGRVVAWEPTDRLAYDFFVPHGSDAPSRVEVSFVAHGTGTRVEVRHGPGHLASGVYASTAIKYAASWDDLIDSFTQYMEA